MNGIIGIIKFVIGQVFVIALDGSQRLLVAGERIYSGEEVVTGDNGAVSIALPDGRTLDLGRDSRWSDVAGVASQKTADVDDEVAALQSAIAQGEDPTQVLEPTAAGNDVVGEAGDGGGGHTAVVLDLTGEIVDISTATGYETTGLASSTDSPIEGGDASTTVLAASDTNNPDSSIPPSLTLAFNNDGTVSFSFTSPPVGFDESDITVDNGTLTSLIQDPNAPMLWTAVLTPASRFEGEVRVSVPDGSYTDESGTSGTGVSGTITVDTLAPDASITIDTVTGDDVINIAESGQNVNVSGKVGNNVQAGDVVMVTVGSETYQTTVNADGVSWSVSVPGSVLAANTEINANVTTRDEAGNETTANTSRTYDADTVAPHASITINTIAGDDSVNIAESNQTVNVTGRVGNNVQAGDTVTVTVGSETYQTTVNADGISWSVSVPGSVLAANTEINASVTTADAAGNSTTASADRSYTVDTVAPEASITIDTVAGDDVVNIDESNQAINVTGKVGNNVQAGDAVTVTVGAETFQTTVNADGVSWSVDVPGSVLAGNTEINASVTTADAAGNSTTVSADRSYTVDTVAPDASITIDTIAGDDRVNIAESSQSVNISGKVSNNVQAGDTVTVAVGSETYQTTVNADGISWSVDIPGSVLASNSAVSASVTTADAAGNTTTAEASRPYAVDTVAPDALISIDTIAGDDRVNIAESSQSVNISGKVGNNVQAGDAVTVTVGNETYQTTVNADGTSWSVNVPGSVLAGNTE
ncbi:retention module-containing protein, partial [Brenneria alni]|uniref:retention module-containing protein n=1 Tax=Brenneria alni TaxID=71656 RepID=UPI000EF236E8